MSNVADSEKYKERREEFIKSCEDYPILEDKVKEYISPSENYKLVVTPLDTGEGYWNCMRGVVTDIKTGEEIFTVVRNYGIWINRWIEHQNGNEYLLCGEDYQGYVTLNLTERKKHVYFHENGFKGWGFCWTDVKEYDKEFDNSIWVEGCYWGAPFEKVEYDFSDPDTVPYKELSRYDDD
jgi:hypothetical protein